MVTIGIEHANIKFNRKTLNKLKFRPTRESIAFQSAFVLCTLENVFVYLFVVYLTTLFRYIASENMLSE
jgi:hypothetical protein